MRLTFAAALSAVLLTGSAFADVKADYVAKCSALLTANAFKQLPPDIAPEAKALVEQSMTEACTCIADKMMAAGEDGALAMAVFMATTEEEAATITPETQRANSVSKAVGLGKSQEEAEAWFDRFDPVIGPEIQACVTEATKKLSGE